MTGSGTNRHEQRRFHADIDSKSQSFMRASLGYTDLISPSLQIASVASPAHRLRLYPVCADGLRAQDEPSLST